MQRKLADPGSVAWLFTKHPKRSTKDLAELKVGDPVVHVNHGIGRYVGLRQIDLGDGDSEFLHLEYADQATLYVPVAQLHLISRYTGVSSDEAPLPDLSKGQEREELHPPNHTLIGCNSKNTVMRFLGDK